VKAQTAWELVESDTRFAATEADFADLRDSVYALRVNRGVLGLLDSLPNLGRKLDLVWSENWISASRGRLRR
jgi:hypothetical protein